MQDTELRTSQLPAIPGKRYFTIGEVGELCCVKTHVLRYWEQEFPQLSPVRRGNRRYYRHEDVLLVRQIRDLLYDQRFTIDGARTQLKKNASSKRVAEHHVTIDQVIAELESVVEILN
ncbi:MerR family transcriptional regulator [uncultured Endozoicomonas sp.]|uniref:MerR family transcriptional regulator n=1 Tax=uncultured Endozoicomonas sp. TaxID=432652 RepID=UPI00261BA8D1|nr:MerR family transcriptional regulator [uncultured Endozoicomonas sp.]